MSSSSGKTSFDPAAMRRAADEIRQLMDDTSPFDKLAGLDLAPGTFDTATWLGTLLRNRRDGIVEQGRDLRSTLGDIANQLETAAQDLETTDRDNSASVLHLNQDIQNLENTITLPAPDFPDSSPGSPVPNSSLPNPATVLALYNDEPGSSGPTWEVYGLPTPVAGEPGPGSTHVTLDSANPDVLGTNTSSPLTDEYLYLPGPTPSGSPDPTGRPIAFQVVLDGLPQQPGPTADGPYQPAPQQPGPTADGPHQPAPQQPGPSADSPYQPEPQLPGPALGLPPQPGPTADRTRPAFEPQQPGPTADRNQQPEPQQPEPAVSDRLVTASSTSGSPEVHATYSPAHQTATTAAYHYSAPAELGTAGVTPSGTVADWIHQAIGVLQANGVHVSGADAQAIATIIAHESGGNPDAINLTDSNAAAGHPSIGLMQCIAPTFGAYKLPGYDSITNPVDNIIAGVRYAISRYGSLGQVPGIESLSHGGSYVGY